MHGFEDSFEALPTTRHDAFQHGRGTHGSHSAPRRSRIHHIPTTSTQYDKLDEVPLVDDTDAHTQATEGEADADADADAEDDEWVDPEKVHRAQRVISIWTFSAIYPRPFGQTDEFLGTAVLLGVGGIQPSGTAKGGACGVVDGV